MNSGAPGELRNTPKPSTAGPRARSTPATRARWLPCGTRRPPGIDPHVVEGIALARHGIPRQHVVGGDEGRRDPHAEGDAEQDQRREHRIAPDALPGETEVVEQHGVSSPTPPPGDGPLRS